MSIQWNDFRLDCYDWFCLIFTVRLIYLFENTFIPYQSWVPLVDPDLREKWVCMKFKCPSNVILWWTLTKSSIWTFGNNPWLLIMDLQLLLGVWEWDNKSQCRHVAESFTLLKLNLCSLLSQVAVSCSSDVLYPYLYRLDRFSAASSKNNESRWGDKTDNFFFFACSEVDGQLPFSAPAPLFVRPL